MEQKKPLSKWTVHIYVTQDGYVEDSYGVWADSLRNALEVVYDGRRLLHSSNHCRCASHTCDRCIDKDIGKEVIEEHKHGDTNV